MSPFKLLIRSFWIILLSISLYPICKSQENSLTDVGRFNLEAAPIPPSLRTPESIIAKFITAEAQVRDALNQHTFKRDVVLQTIGPGGEVTGEYIRNSQFLFDDKGNAVAGHRVFRLTVEPATAPDPHHMSNRYFSGQVWIDAQTFQILKIKGVVEPRGKQRFPIFETWREPMTASLFLPSRTLADDVLHFPNSDVHYRIQVRYYDYKLFASKLTVKDLDEPAN
jgi:hypothetical protein